MEGTYPGTYPVFQQYRNFCTVVQHFYTVVQHFYTVVQYWLPAIDRVIALPLVCRLSLLPYSNIAYANA